MPNPIQTPPIYQNPFLAPNNLSEIHLLERHLELGPSRQRGQPLVHLAWGGVAWLLPQLGSSRGGRPRHAKLSREAMPPQSDPSPPITELLRQWRAGNKEVESQLWQFVYQELKGLARHIRHGKGGPKSETTTIVHEAYLRLLGSSPEADFKDRGHFFAVAARVMRFLLVDEARRRLSQKRDGEASGAEIPESAAAPMAQSPEEVLAVHQALKRLAAIHPRYEQLVELRYFAGLSIEETAAAMEVSRPTVVRDWRAAKTWLYGELRAHV